MLGSGDCMEFWRECFEVCVFSEAALGLIEIALSLSLKVNLGRAKRVGFGDEVVFIDGLYDR